MPDDRWPPGDGDPCEYGGTYRDGRRWIHPPWGPIEVDDGPLPWLKAVPPAPAVVASYLEEETWLTASRDASSASTRS